MRVQGLSTWAREPGLNNARTFLEERPPRSFNPLEVRTPEEALTYIDRLYKSGRMEDLAALLRRSKVFREAWLMLQQPAPAGSWAGVEMHGSSGREDTRAPAPLPVLHLAPRQGTLSRPNPESGELRSATMRLPPTMADPATDYRVEPGSLKAKASGYLLNAALQAYQRQDRQYGPDQESAPRLSLRV